MSPFHRLKSPEEIELDRKRLELADFQKKLSDRKRVLSMFKNEIRMFEQVYEEILGARISELEELEWELDGLLGQSQPDLKINQRNSDKFSYSLHQTDLLDEDEELVKETPQKSLKSLYREVAKAIHPDLASDEDERKRRQELMAEANNAYQKGDRSTLENIWNECEPPADVTTEIGIAMELVRVIRQIAGVRQNILEIDRQLEELEQTDIYTFKLRVDEALSDGIDLLAEMAATVAMNIQKVKKRLATLRGEAPGADSAATPVETRFVRFPDDRSYGKLYERKRESVDYRDWQRIGNARGVKEVFLDKALRLDVEGIFANDLQFLENLDPNDIQALHLHDVDDEALQYLSHLTGLEEFYLSNAKVSDFGLWQLKTLSGLVRISIYHTPISDVGLVVLADIKGLRWLTCSGTEITEQGLNRFRQALPTCKAVNFKWRYEKN